MLVSAEETKFEACDSILKTRDILAL